MTTQDETGNPAAEDVIEGAEAGAPAIPDQPAKPILKAFLTCDRIVDEAGKKSCLGVFDAISSPFFPVVHPHMYVYMILFAGRGEWDFGIALKDPDDNEIFKHEQKVRLRGDTTTDLAFEFQGLPLQQPGTYWFEITLGGEEFCEFPFSVSALPEKADYTPEQLQGLLADPDTVKHVRAELTCPNCGDKPTFQMNLDPAEAVPDDVTRFPESDEFTCAKCNQTYDIAAARRQMKYILGTAAPKVNA